MSMRENEGGGAGPLARPELQEVVFFLANEVLGGHEVLVVRLAKALQERGVAVRIIGRGGGYPRLGSEEAGVPFEVLGMHAPLGPESAVVASAGDHYRVLNLVRPHRETRMLYWSIHPLSLLGLIPRVARHTEARRPVRLAWTRLRRRGLIRRTAALIRVAHEAGGLAFMDRENLDTVASFYGLDLAEPLYIPIPTPRPEVPPREPGTRRGDALTIGWIGRLVDFKVWPLLRLAEDLESWRRSHPGIPIQLQVAGDGDRGDLVAQAMENHPHLGVIPLGKLDPSRLTEWMLGLDMLVACGMSCLEGAMRGVPTIVQDVQATPIRGPWHYRWLHESNGFDLGRYSANSGRALDSLLDELLQDPDAVAASCHRHWEVHHCQDAMLEGFLQKLRSSRLCLGALEAAGLADTPRSVRKRGR